MGAGRIFAAIVLVAASAAAGIIVFNINWRGYSILCVDGCLSPESLLRFSPGFALLFVKYLLILLAVWLVFATGHKMLRNYRTRGSVI
jgi:hypothetical protein